MAPILQELDREWSELATSPRARRALIRWANSHRHHRAQLQRLRVRRRRAHALHAERMERKGDRRDEGRTEAG